MSGAAAGLPPELLDGLPAGHPRTVFHLLSCVRCREAALGGMLSAEEVAGKPGPKDDPRRRTLRAGDLALPSSRAAAALAAPLSEEERLQVGRAVDTLERLPVEDLGPTWAGKRYATPAVLAALLERGEQALRSAPAQSERLGQVGLFLAGQIEEKDPGWVPPGVIRSGLLVGAARRLQGQLNGASRAFHQIGPFLAGPLEEAAYAREVGLVRWQQGLPQDAEALLARAAETFAEAGEPGHEAACWALVGLLRREEVGKERVARALAPLLRSLSGLSPEEFPRLTLRIRLALAQAEAERADFAKAEGQLNLARSAARFVGPGEGDLPPDLSIAWTEARVHDLEGQPREAEQLLLPVRSALLTAGRLGEAALASLDLALFAAHRANLDRAASLVDELAFRFQGEPGLVFAVQALADFEESFLENPKEAGGAHGLACRFLRQSFRAKGLPVEPPPFP